MQKYPYSKIIEQIADRHRESSFVRRYFLLLLVLLPISTFLLISCQSQEKELSLLDDDISSISVSKSDGYGGINDNYFTTIDKKTQISKFQGILKRAKSKKKKIDVDKESSDYDLVIDYGKDKKHLMHLVLGDKGEKSRMVYMGNENNGFNIPSKDTEDLRNILDIP